MKRFLSVTLLGCLAATLLSGCLFRAAEELYMLPKLSADYANLQDELEALTDSGLEYAAPISGENTQSIQFQDLDGDGVDEAVAYFRDTSGDKTIHIEIFRRSEEDLYENVAEILGDGTAIHSVVYANLDESDPVELVVNYQISDQVYSLHAYSLENYTVSELLSAGCSRYVVADLDQDASSELVLFQSDDQGGKRAEYYDWDSGQLRAKEAAALSSDLQTITKVRTSALAGGQAAIYVTGRYSGNDTRLITDVLSVVSGELKNVTMDEAAGSSTTTIRGEAADLFATDINDDGVCEIPFAKEMTELGSSDVWLVRWMQYRQDGTETLACATIWSPDDGWYLEVPESWLDHISVVRSESTIRSESTVSLYTLVEETEAVSNGDAADTAVPFLTLYTNLDTNQVSQSAKEGRFLLQMESDRTYAAELNQSSWEEVPTVTEVKERFHRIPSDWSDD